MPKKKKSKSKKLNTELEKLRHAVGLLQDREAIRELQYAYGYYLDKCLYNEVVELFCEDCEVRFGGGRFIGRPGIMRLYLDRFRQRFTAGYNGPIDGFLLDHLQLQGIVHVADDRRSAHGRFRCFMQAGTHLSQGVVQEGRLQQWWEGGVYENEYVREDGIWKIRLLDYNVTYWGEYDKGWAGWDKHEIGRITTTWPEDPAGADELISPAPGRWPMTPVIPFHYRHPVTGKKWKAAKRKKAK
jgi:hypothetical protein